MKSFSVNSRWKYRFSFEEQFGNMMFRLIICLWKSQIQVQSMKGTRASGARTGLRVCPLCTYFLWLKTAELKRTRPDGHNSGRTSSSAVGCYGIEGARACVRASNKQTKPLYSANFTMQTLKIKTNSWFFWVAKVWNMYHVFLIIKFAEKKPKQTKWQKPT